MQRQYKNTPPLLRPKIFGMTASPVNSKRDVVGSIATLEKNLFSKSISTTKSALGEYLTVPQERIVYFSPDPFFDIAPRISQMNSKFPDIRPYVETRIGDPLNFLDKFGPWATDRAVELAVNQLLEQLLKVKNSTSLTENPDVQTAFKEFDYLFPEEIDLLKNQCEGFAACEGWGQNAPPPSQADLSNKINALVNLLSEYDVENFCGIIFVRERMTGFLLTLVLQNHPQLTQFKSEFVVGHGNSNSKKTLGNFLKMKFQKQQKVLSRFGKGELNLLVATQVAEEGIDVNPCNVVIRYDLGDTLINYIQSRGRGRSYHAEFVILAPASDSEVLSKVDMFHAAESKINDILTKNRIPRSEKPMLSHSFTIQENGITINYDNCLWMLDEYCSLLPKDGFYTPHAEYDEVIDETTGICKCDITLPSIVPQECRLINGPEASSPQEAKVMAAFELMVLLNKYGELDNLGSPQNVDQDGTAFYIDPDNKELDDSSHRRILDCILKTPRPFQGTFSEQESVYVNYFCITPIIENGTPRYLTVGFISFSLLLECEREFDTLIATTSHHVKILTLEQKLAIDSDRLMRFTKFHLTLLKVVLRTEYPDDLAFTPLCVPFNYNSEMKLDFPIPTCPNKLINWDMLEVCYLDEGTPFPSDFTANDDISQVVMVDPLRYKHVYFPRVIEFDKNPLSAPENPRESSFESIQKLYEVRYLCTTEIKLDQPVVAASSIGFLFSCKSRPKQFSEVSILPQLCTLFPIKRQYLLDLQNIPLLFTQTSHNLLIWELKETLSLSAPIDILKSACTCPSAQMEGNYERLETYGDRFTCI